MEARLTRVNGVLKIEIDGQIYEPLSFKSFRPTARNITEFYEAGVRLFSILTSGLKCMLGVPYSLYGESWTDYESYDFRVVDEQIDFFIQHAPNGYFALMFQVDTRPWYIEKEQCSNSFTHLSQIAASPKWREYASKYMQALIRHVESKYGERIYGYFILGGMTTEWFSEHDYMETSDVKQDAYRQYMQNDNVLIPTKERREQPARKMFLDPEQDQDLISYMRFHNELISDTILYFAAKAQEILNHKKLLGVYYGYLFELNHNRLFHTGTLDYEKVFMSPDIDMISSPSSYKYRHHEDCSAFMLTYDTLDLHDKLYYLEFDHITHLAPQYIEGKKIPGYDSKFRTEQETIDVMRRDFMLCQSKGAALWWFDMFEGWFYSEGMMQSVKQMIDISTYLSGLSNRSVAKIAVLAEGHSLYYVNKNCGLNDDVLRRQIGELNRMGMPYDLYSMGDFSSIDFFKYELYIFLDAYYISEEHKRLIKENIKQAGKSILWIYAPNYISGHIDVNQIGQITDIRVRQTANEECDTLFYVEDLDSEPLMWDQDTGKCILASNNKHGYRSFYSTKGNLHADMLRMMAKEAGIHMYCDNKANVYVNESIIGVYSNINGEVVIQFENDETLEELFEQENYETVHKQLVLNMRIGEAKLFVRKGIK